MLIAELARANPSLSVAIWGMLCVHNPLHFMSCLIRCFLQESFEGSNSKENGNRGKRQAICELTNTCNKENR